MALVVEAELGMRALGPEAAQDMAHTLLADEAGDGIERAYDDHRPPFIAIA
jgi:hypothetical protein